MPSGRERFSRAVRSCRFSVPRWRVTQSGIHRNQGIAHNNLSTDSISFARREVPQVQEERQARLHLLLLSIQLFRKVPELIFLSFFWGFSLFTCLFLLFVALSVDGIGVVPQSKLVPVENIENSEDELDKAEDEES